MHIFRQFVASPSALPNFVRREFAFETCGTADDCRWIASCVNARMRPTQAKLSRKRSSSYPPVGQGIALDTSKALILVQSGDDGSRMSVGYLPQLLGVNSEHRTKQAHGRYNRSAPFARFCCRLPSICGRVRGNGASSSVRSVRIDDRNRGPCSASASRSRIQPGDEIFARTAGHGTERPRYA